MLRGAIVGFGEVARNGHWPAYARSADVALVGVVDRSAERRCLAETLVPGLVACESIDELARRITLDFVDICTPPALHPQPMLDAIDRGWHVLCEKPFLLDAHVVETVRVRAEAARVSVIPVHNWKYAPIVQAATDALRGGAVGTITGVEIQVSRLQAAPTAEVDRGNWRRDPAIAGGGILMDHGWHAVYLALHWFGEHFTGVRASLNRPPSGDVEDEADVRVSFPSGEAAITLTWNGTRRANTMRISGTTGEIAIDDDTLTVRGDATTVRVFPSALSQGSHHDDWFTLMLPDVVACFRSPSLARRLFDEAAECLSIIQRAYRSDLSLV